MAPSSSGACLMRQAPARRQPAPADRPWARACRNVRACPARSLADPAAVQARLARLREPHIAPLTDFVMRRARRGGGEAVPWFDPADADVEARALLL